jgi:hypothetical protein
MEFTTNLSRSVSILTALCTTSLISCQCQKVLIPSSDTTPPSVVMIAGIADKSDIVTSTPVSESVRSPNVQLAMLATAQDMDGGVSNVQIEGDVDTVCRNNGLGQVISAYFLVKNPDNSKPGQQGCTNRVTGLNINLGDVVKCNAGFSFVSASGTFTAAGVNFSGGSNSTATYSFSIQSQQFMSALSPKDLRSRGAQKTCVVRLKHVSGLKRTSCTELELPPE